MVFSIASDTHGNVVTSPVLIQRGCGKLWFLMREVQGLSFGVESESGGMEAMCFAPMTQQVQNWPYSPGRRQQGGRRAHRGGAEGWLPRSVPAVTEILQAPLTVNWCLARRGAWRISPDPEGEGKTEKAENGKTAATQFFFSK